MANGNIRILGLPRYDLGSLASGVSVSGTMPLSKLTNREPWDVARLLSLDPRLCYVKASPTMPLGYYGPAPRVGGVSWVNHPFGLGSKSRTLLLDPNVSTFTPSRVLPDGKTDIAGTWSGTAADVDDDPYSADANKNTCTGASSLTPGVRYTFATPASTPLTGADRQMIRVKVSWTGDAPTGFAFELSDGATVLGDLEFTVTGANPEVTNGAVLLMPWDATDLVTADGSGVNLRIDCTLGSGSDDISIEAVDWLCDTGVSGGSILADTGWISSTMDQVDADWGDTASGSVGGGPQQTLLHVFGDSGNVSGVGSVVTFFRDPTNSTGVVDLGEFVVGPVFIPRINIAWGKFSGGRFRDTAIEGDGGSRWGVRREPLRDVTVKLMNLSPKEAYSLQERLWRAGSLQPYVVSLRPESQYEQAMTTIYGTTKSYPSINALPGDLRSIEWEMEEKL